MFANARHTSGRKQEREREKRTECARAQTGIRFRGGGINEKIAKIIGGWIASAQHWAYIFALRCVANPVLRSPDCMLKRACLSATACERAVTTSQKVKRKSTRFHAGLTPASSRKRRITDSRSALRLSGAMRYGSRRVDTGMQRPAGRATDQAHCCDCDCLR